MRVFVTGATGFIGSAVVRELIAAGHQVLGLCRDPHKAAALAAAGAEVHAGSIEDLDSLRRGAAAADAVIHLAFNHDFSRFAANCEDDRRVIGALADTLAGSTRPLVVTSGTALAGRAPGQAAAHEDAPSIEVALNPRAESELVAAAAAARGVHVSIVRLPQVHDQTRQGLITFAIAAFRERGECAYVGDGAQRWAAAHISDVARLYRLAVEKGARHAVYHAVGEVGVSMKDIVTTLGTRLALPVRALTPGEAAPFFGWLAMFAALDMPASSDQTRAALGWQPGGPTLLADLAQLADA